jgi:hypothetical protein
VGTRPYIYSLFYFILFIEQDHTCVHTSYLPTKCQPTELELSEQSKKKKKKKKRLMMESLWEPQRPQLFHHAQSNKTRKVGVVVDYRWVSIRGKAGTEMKSGYYVGR